MSARAWRMLAIAALWALAVRIVIYPQLVIPVQRPFTSSYPRYHLSQLLHHETPQLMSHFAEAPLDGWLGQWNLTTPVVAALPPMYAESAFDNPGFLNSFVDHGMIIFYNGPYPHPKIEISEHVRGNGDPGFDLYHFDNRKSNAALSMNVSGLVWPYGYTAWYDVLFTGWDLDVHTPNVIGSDGKRVWPASVRAVSPLNHVQQDGRANHVTFRHLSPIVWTFSGDGHLDPTERSFAVERVGNQLEVSYIPWRPTTENVYGMMLLAPALDHSHDTPAPAWWVIDEKFRHAVVDGRPPEEKRALLQQLIAAFPNHRMLEHYRVIAELGGDGLDQVWLEDQQKDCDISTWYLVAWTHVPWQRVKTLPCIKTAITPPFSPWRADIAQSVIIAYRTERDDQLLRDFARLAATSGYFSRGERQFNYAPNDFAYLWLRSLP